MSDTEQPRFKSVSKDERELLAAKERDALAIKIKKNATIKERIDAARLGGRRLLLFNNDQTGAK